MCWDGSGWMWGHGWGGGRLLTALMLALFAAVVITGMILAARYLKPGGFANGTRPATTTGAQDVLAHRFARGEIDEAEFRQRIGALKEQR